MAIRISKVIRELNVGSATLVDFLHNKGFSYIDDNLNQKLTDEQYNLLIAEFSHDRNIREEANRFLQERQTKRSVPEEIESQPSKPESHTPNIVITGHVNLDDLPENSEELEMILKKMKPLADFDWDAYTIHLENEKKELVGIEATDGWSSILVAYRDNIPVEGKVTGIIKGGYSVSLYGMFAFLPGSQIPRSCRQSIVGSTQQFIVWRINRRYNNVVVIPERTEKKHFISNVRKGDLIRGKVIDFLEDGVVFDIGNYDITIPNSEFIIGYGISVKEYFLLNHFYTLLIKDVTELSLGIMFALKEIEIQPKVINHATSYSVGDIVRGRIKFVNSDEVCIDIGGLYATLPINNIKLLHYQSLNCNETYNFKICSINSDSITLMCDETASPEIEEEYYKELEYEEENVYEVEQNSLKRSIIDYESVIMTALENGCGDGFGFD